MTEEYQTLTLTETHEELIVGTMEYPLQLAGILYIKFIQYEEIDTNKGIFYKPIKFVTLLPQNILKRENIWTQDEEDMIKFAAQEAKDRENIMAEYREAAEEEMRRRSQEIPPESTSLDDDIIDSEFKTEMDQLDPNYM